MRRNIPNVNKKLMMKEIKIDITNFSSSSYFLFALLDSMSKSKKRCIKYIFI